MSIQRLVRPPASSTAFERSEKHNLDLRTGLLSIQHMIQSGDHFRANDAASALYPLAPYNPQLLALRAECALATDAFKEAAELYDQLLCQIETAEVWAGKGEALLGLKRYRRAASAFQRACALEPAVISHRIRTAHCFVNAGQPRDAYLLLRNITMHPADNPDLLRVRALAFEAMGQLKEAFSDALAACRLTAPAPSVLNCLFRTARSPGDFQRTSEILAQMMDAPDTTPRQWMSLARHPEFKLPTKRKAQLRSALEGNLLSDDSRAAYNFALFRHYHKTGNARLALEFLRHYHNCAASQLPDQQASEQIQYLSNVQTSALPASKSRVQPIFVCGLPGTGRRRVGVLLETAANCGPARELDLVPAVMARLMRTMLQEGRHVITRDDLMGVQSHLRDGLQQAACDTEIVIDTTPLNFIWSGIIAAALPEARIVHVKRGAAQTKWGLFSSEIPSQQMPCQHNLAAVSRFQSQSDALMTWWETMHPRAIIPFEGDTADKTRIKQVIEACNLKYTTACNKVDLTPSQDWQSYAKDLSLT